MSCHQCAKKLPFSAQKVACPLCNFITCKKCLAHGLPRNGGKTKVCLQCYERVTSNLSESDPREADPPINYLRRMEAQKRKRLDRPCLSLQEKAVVNDADKLTQRLNALTAEERSNLPTEAELQSRVDALNEFLLTHKLRTISTQPIESDQNAVKDLVDQVQDEARLSAVHGGSPEANASTSNFERVYCSLCDNLASIQCPACMDQEYCKYCFQRVHKSRHMRQHEGISISKPNKN